MGRNIIKILLMDEAIEFLHKIPRSASNKMNYIIHRVMVGEHNSDIFKKLEDSDIWEFRIRYNNISYRLFAFWDTNNNTLIIATHGIIKKTQKTPSKEIKKAEKLKDNYFKNK